MLARISIRFDNTKPDDFLTVHLTQLTVWYHTMEAKKRSVNMTPVEKALLADLCIKYQATIDNKKTDVSNE